MEEFFEVNSVWLATINASAGFFAAIVWGFFAMERYKQKRYIFMAANVALTIVNLMVGIGYMMFAFRGNLQPTWIRWIVFPAVVAPAAIHLYAWIAAKKLLAKVHLKDLK